MESYKIHDARTFAFLFTFLVVPFWLWSMKYYQQIMNIICSLVDVCFFSLSLSVSIWSTLTIIVHINEFYDEKVFRLTHTAGRPFNFNKRCLCQMESGRKMTYKHPTDWDFIIQLNGIKQIFEESITAIKQMCCNTQKFDICH